MPNSSYSVILLLISYSDIQYYIEVIIKRHETLTTVPPIHVYISRINNRLVNKTENGEKVPSLEVVEVVLVQFHLEPSNLVFLKTYNT